MWNTFCIGAWGAAAEEQASLSGTAAAGSALVACICGGGRDGLRNDFN